MVKKEEPGIGVAAKKEKKQKNKDEKSAVKKKSSAKVKATAWSFESAKINMISIAFTGKSGYLRIPVEKSYKCPVQGCGNSARCVAV